MSDTEYADAMTSDRPSGEGVDQPKSKATCESHGHLWGNNETCIMCEAPRVASALPSCTYCSDYGCEMCPDSEKPKLRARVAMLEGLLRRCLCYLSSYSTLHGEIKASLTPQPAPLTEGK